MMWFWLNVPLMVTFFAAMCGIPLYKVLTDPTWAPQRIITRRPRTAQPAPASTPALAGASR